MLKEYKDVRQVAGEGERRWFLDEYFDLIVWYDAHRSIKGFQLCYDKKNNERAVTWTREDGYSHHKIDDGDVTGRAKMTPVLVADGIFARDDIADRFLEESREIERDISFFVYNRLKSFALD
jgi:hypothetical protein